ncbi:MAG: DUF429 domain-containing protein [Nitrospirae bacterium]|nr:DUF429 domain-containing protein [Nitrospirota bacterium]
MVAWRRDLDASVVGIDIPCRWSRTGRTRPCERAQATKGLHAFARPSKPLTLLVGSSCALSYSYHQLHCVALTLLRRRPSLAAKRLAL